MRELRILNSDPSLPRSQKKIRSLITSIITTSQNSDPIKKTKRIAKEILQHRSNGDIIDDDFKIPADFSFFFWLILCHKFRELNAILSTEIAMRTVTSFFRETLLPTALSLKTARRNQLSSSSAQETFMRLIGKAFRRLVSAEITHRHIFAQDMKIVERMVELLRKAHSNCAIGNAALSIVDVVRLEKERDHHPPFSTSAMFVPGDIQHMLSTARTLSILLSKLNEVTSDPSQSCPDTICCIAWALSQIMRNNLRAKSFFNSESQALQLLRTLEHATTNASITVVAETICVIVNDHPDPLLARHIFASFFGAKFLFGALHRGTDEASVLFVGTAICEILGSVLPAGVEPSRWTSVPMKSCLSPDPINQLNFFHDCAASSSAVDAINAALLRCRSFAEPFHLESIRVLAKIISTLVMFNTPEKKQLFLKSRENTSTFEILLDLLDLVNTHENNSLLYSPRVSAANFFIANAMLCILPSSSDFDEENAETSSEYGTEFDDIASESDIYTWFQCDKFDREATSTSSMNLLSSEFRHLSWFDIVASVRTEYEVEETQTVTNDDEHISVPHEKSRRILTKALNSVRWIWLHRHRHPIHEESFGELLKLVKRIE